jgi:hypothetical protein
VSARGGAGVSKFVADAGCTNGFAEAAPAPAGMGGAGIAGRSVARPPQQSHSQPARTPPSKRNPARQTAGMLFMRRSSSSRMDWQEPLLPPARQNGADSNRRKGTRQDRPVRSPIQGQPSPEFSTNVGTPKFHKVLLPLGLRDPLLGRPE